MKRVLKGLLIALVLMIAYLYYQANVVKLGSVELTTNKLPVNSQLKILQISDVHNKKFPDNNKRMISLIEKAEADVIVITGDLIDESTRDLSYALALVEGVKSVTPEVFFVSGNHEWRTGLQEQLSEALQSIGVVVLNNANTTHFMQGVWVNICGVDDPYSKHDSLAKALDKIDAEHYTILLAHAPNIVTTNQIESVDLVLSGHTHGGQLRVPVIGALVAPGQGFLPQYDQGLYAIGSKTQLYIDSGLGTSIMPLRFMNQSQMTLITVKGVN